MLIMIIRGASAGEGGTNCPCAVGIIVIVARKSVREKENLHDKENNHQFNDNQQPQLSAKCHGPEAVGIKTENSCRNITQAHIVKFFSSCKNTKIPSVATKGARKNTKYDANHNKNDKLCAEKP